MDKDKEQKQPGKEDSRSQVKTGATMVETPPSQPMTAHSAESRMPCPTVDPKAGETRDCESCRDHIKGQVVHALGKTWHPEHFVCTACKKPISQQFFNIHDGHPYCEQDYTNKFLNKCRSCGLPIKDVTIRALGGTWHKEHFVCQSCSAQLAGQGFFERDNSPFCQKCFEGQFAPKCSSCEKPITETAVLALGKHFHSGCLKCKRCQMDFSDNPFETINGDPYCIKCSTVTQQTLINNSSM
ncbi:LIM domain [Nesidiocoris tenuis]|uniref:LIM domain n=1 Tax=Nesidiocoris tenuis TaxID=355587 RepID=A0ABN7AZZ9_9HEMI|nr:LIM domain [Nesidiocoris tenuis]